MRSVLAKLVIACAALVAAVALLLPGEDTAHAVATGQLVDSESAPNGHSCPAVGAYNPDAGDLVNGLIKCTTKGYKSVRVETETGTFYVGGKRGMTQVNVIATGLKRCPTCINGPAFEADSNWGVIRCMSGDDAGVSVKAFCGK